MKNLSILLSGLILWSCNSLEMKEKKKSSIHYPETVKVDSVNNYFGTDVFDPYVWLEDDRSAETETWVKAQNKVTFSYLDKIPFRDKIKSRLEELWNYPKEGAPFKRGDWFYYYKNSGLQNQYVLYRNKGEGSDEELFLDPNTLKEDGTAALGSTSFSADGKYFSYAIADAGSDWQTIYVRDTESKEDLSDTLKWCKFTGMAWAGEGFYYSRYDEPEGSALSKANEYHKCFYHKLGTPQSDDVLIFDQPEHPQRNVYAQTSDDENFLFVGVSEGTSGNMLYFKDLRNPDSEFILLNENFENDHSFVDNVGDDLFILTNLEASNYKLIKVNASSPEQSNWEDVISNHNSHVLQSVSFVGGKMFVKYMQDAYNKIYQYSYSGEMEKTINMPGDGIGTIRGFGGKQDDTYTYYTFTSFTFPSEIYKYDVATGKSESYKKSEVKFNPEDFETKQVFFTSKDGTKVPMFIVHKKGLKLDGTNPTYLYSYGGFNISLNPNFDLRLIPWLENGGVYAMPNIRGGGEYGEEWHKGGMLLNKQNVFDDFISAAEYLIRENYTSSDKLCISGRSNGGLLVGACMTQRPDLFAVAIPGVGVMDMLKFHEFTIGWAWAVEYGNSEDSTNFQNLVRYSPYHNIMEKDYPATMVFTADHDDRVVPAHSFKFISRLQEKHTGESPVLIRIDVDAGHGAGKPTHMQIAEWADIWAFVLENMGEKFE